MYLPRELLAQLYTHLQQTTHQLSPPVLILSALDPDALCATRILTALLKGDFIPHKIQPISGYADLARAGAELVQPMRTQNGGEGGIVICLGLGAQMDLEEQLFAEETEGDVVDGVPETKFTGYGGVECWVVDARRPWDLSNVFAGHDSLPDAEIEGLDSRALSRRLGHDQGKILQSYKPGRGGIVCFDNGDIDLDTAAERIAYFKRRTILESFEPGFDFDREIHDLKAQLGRGAFDSPEADDDQSEDESGNNIPESGQNSSRKRKAFSDDESDSDLDNERSALRRRSNSSSVIPSSPDRLLQQRHGLGGSSDTSRAASPAASQSSELSPSRTETRQLHDNLRKLQKCRKELETYDATLEAYWTLGSSFSEPISSMMYSLVSELGREDNDLLWWAIVGVQSMEILGRTNTGLGLAPLSTLGGSAGWNGSRGDYIRATLRDEVRRLNPPNKADIFGDVAKRELIQTNARGPNDTTIRLSPEPRFLLVRHWSLYDSMLHSPYLSSKLHVWSDAGQRRLYKLLAKMGVSIAQSKQSYTHMDKDLKNSLRDKLLKYGPQYGLDGLVPPMGGNGTREGWGFVRSWGWKACLSATDVGVIVGSVLDVGNPHASSSTKVTEAKSSETKPRQSYSQQIHNADALTRSRNAQDAEALEDLDNKRVDLSVARFWLAYDALGSVDALSTHIPTAQHLARAILRTGTSLIAKRQIRHLRAFRMAVVKDGPDIALFTDPGALVKLALWVAEAIIEMEGGRGSSAKKGSEFVMACLDEQRGNYLVVGLGGGGAVALDRERQKRRAERRREKLEKKEQRKAEKARLRDERREQLGLDELGVSDDEDELDELESDEDEDEDDLDSDDEDDERSRPRGHGRNRFGNAFKEVLDQTGIMNRVESFDHCIARVRKEDLSGFLESLSLKVVVG